MKIRGTTCCWRAEAESLPVPSEKNVPSRSACPARHVASPIPHSCNVAPLEWLGPRKCSFISLVETVHLRRLRNNIVRRGDGGRAVTGSVEGTFISLGTDPE